MEDGGTGYQKLLVARDDERGKEIHGGM